MSAWVAAGLSVLVLFGTARVLGALAKRCRQPAVLGELVAGLLLGPTVLARIAPELQPRIFPSFGSACELRETAVHAALLLFLLAAGLNLDLLAVRRHKCAVTGIAALGFLVPLLIGWTAGAFIPERLGIVPGVDRAAYALFIGTAMAISALPLVARMLMDVGIYHTPLGALIMSAAALQDFAAWLLLAGIIGLAGPQGGLSWSHGLLAVFLGSALIGTLSPVQVRARMAAARAAAAAPVPLFFASLGLRVDLLADFRLETAAALIALGTLGKVAGCLAGARIGRLPWRAAFTAAAALNARGAMEIVVAALALDAGFISREIFVALLMFAVVTSLASAPVLRLLTRPQQDPEAPPGPEWLKHGLPAE